MPDNFNASGRKHIVTPRNVTLDQCLALAAFQYLAEDYRGAEIAFVDAKWSEPVHQGDVAIGMLGDDGGIVGKSGDDEVMHSCLKTILEQCSDTMDYRVMKPLVEVVDAYVMYGSQAFNRLAPGISNEMAQLLMATSVIEKFRSVKSGFRRDASGMGRDEARNWIDNQLVIYWRRFFQDFMQHGRMMASIPVFRKRGMISTGDSRKVSIVYDCYTSALGGILFEEGARVLVIVEEPRMFIVRHDDETLPMDHEYLRAAVDRAGEQIGSGRNRWSVSKDGSRLAWGGSENEVNGPSRVDPVDMARAIDRALLIESERVEPLVLISDRSSAG